MNRATKIGLGVGVGIAVTGIAGSFAGGELFDHDVKKFAQQDMQQAAVIDSCADALSDPNVQIGNGVLVAPSGQYSECADVYQYRVKLVSKDETTGTAIFRGPTATELHQEAEAIRQGSDDYRQVGDDVRLAGILGSVAAGAILGWGFWDRHRGRERWLNQQQLSTA